jgi:hypothetical protein
LADVLTINGGTITLANFNAQLDRLTPITKGGIPELQFSKIVGALAALPDAWSGKAVTLTMGGTLVFTGDVQGYLDRYIDRIGWVREYRALGLRNRADYIPITDSVSFTDTCVFNLPGDDPNFVGSRAGLTVGQIVKQILTMTTNAVALIAAGIGAYTSLGPITLPALTLSDLNALTVIPPWQVTVSGERILQALEGFVQTTHPNHWLHVQPDGTIRFLDLRLASNNTLTLGSDSRLDMPSFTRDYSDCYSQVGVRGNTLAIPATLQTTPWQGSSSADGGIAEDFAWGAYTNAQAKTNWLPSDFNQPSIAGDSNDYGTCTCPDTTHVTVTSHDATATWAANFWAQGGGQAQGQIYLYADLIPGISQLYAARIVANTALTAAGTSILTLDRALPAVTYNSYQIWGLAENASVVWRRYKVTNANLASALLNFFPYPVPVRGAAGSAAAALTSSPVGFVQWSNSGSAPYNMSSCGITVDSVNGRIYFDRPTALIFGSQVTTPNNVLAFLPIGTGGLSTYAPSSSTYSGTLYTVEGIQRTKFITVRDWRDVSNSSNMAAFASEFLDSVKNVVVEGTVPYHGLLSTYLTCGSTGQAVSIAGNGYTTGWEALALPVISVEVVFNNSDQGTSYDTYLHLSNRRGRFTSDNFLRPNVTGLQIGSGGDTFGGAAPTYMSHGPTGDASNWQVGGAVGTPGASQWMAGGMAGTVEGNQWSTNIESPTGPSSAWDTRLQ